MGPEFVLDCVFVDYGGELDTPCWVWRGRRDRDGYGLLNIGGREWRAHRFAFELLSGDGLARGLQLDHLCRRRACVNPLHLEAVTGEENQARKAPERWTEAVGAAGLAFAPRGRWQPSLWHAA